MSDLLPLLAIPVYLAGAGITFGVLMAVAPDLLEQGFPVLFFWPLLWLAAPAVLLGWVAFRVTKFVAKKVSVSESGQAVLDFILLLGVVGVILAVGFLAVRW